MAVRYDAAVYVQDLERRIAGLLDQFVWMLVPSATTVNRMTSQP